MLKEVIERVSFFSLLHRLDQEMAEEVQGGGCVRCGGRLDSGKYLRKPRGSPVEIPQEYCERLSLCCSVPGCRSRRLPPSCLFMGRRVYWGAVVLLVMTLRDGREMGYSASKIQAAYGVRRSTLKRWMVYFREVFPASRAWKRIRGRVGPEIEDGDISELLDHFVTAQGGSQAGLVSCLMLLSGADSHRL